MKFSKMLAIVNDAAADALQVIAVQVTDDIDDRLSGRSLKWILCVKFFAGSWSSWKKRRLPYCTSSLCS